MRNGGARGCAEWGCTEVGLAIRSIAGAQTAALTSGRGSLSAGNPAGWQLNWQALQGGAGS
jgi:hypothetical protein